MEYRIDNELNKAIRNFDKEAAKNEGKNMFPNHLVEDDKHRLVIDSKEYQKSPEETSKNWIINQLSDSNTISTADKSLFRDDMNKTSTQVSSEEQKSDFKQVMSSEQGQAQEPQQIHESKQVNEATTNSSMENL